MALRFRFATQFAFNFLSTTQLLTEHTLNVNTYYDFCWDTHTNNRNSSLQHHDWGMEVQLLSTKGERRQLCGWSAETRAESSQFCAPAQGCAITLPEESTSDFKGRGGEQGCMPAGL